MKPTSPFASRPAGLFGQPPAQKAEALFQQAWALHQGGQTPQALALYEQVIQLQPKHANALHLAGVITLQQGDARRAVDLMTRALKVDRDNASIHNNRGAAYAELREHAYALSNYSRAIELERDFANAYNNRGCVLIKLNRHAEAVADFDQAIALKPGYFEAFNNRGNALSELRRYDEARQSYERAVALQPASADAHWNLGMCCLRMGDFEPGWHHSEWRLARWRELGWKAHYDGTCWDGTQPVQGRTILVHSEQGLGDTIQFCRYAPLLVGQGARVILEVQPALVPLLQALPNVTVVARGSELPAYELYCPLLSLPKILRTDLAHIPAAFRASPVEPAREARWTTLLGERTRARVGIAWSGNADHVDDYKRSMPLATFAAGLLGPDRGDPAEPQIEWISLHKDVRDSDKPTLQADQRIRDFAAEQGDFLDVVALCAQLDLVITVDTSLAHAAASCGTPVWLLLSHNADWRWLTNRDDSPWYDTLTLYRQDAPGDWGGVLTRMKADLRVRFS